MHHAAPLRLPSPPSSGPSVTKRNRREKSMTIFQQSLTLSWIFFTFFCEGPRIISKGCWFIRGQNKYSQILHAVFRTERAKSYRKIYMRRVKFGKSDTSHFFWEDRETQREERLWSSGQSDTKHICGCVISDCVFAVQRLQKFFALLNW